VKTYCQQTLKFSFEQTDVTSEDNEPFGFDRLQAHQYSKALLDNLKSQQPENLESYFQTQQTALTGQGILPLAGFAESAFASIALPATRAWRHYQQLLNEWPDALKPQHIELEFTVDTDITIHFSADLNELRQNQTNDANCLISLTAQSLIKKDQIQYHNLILPWLQHLSACADNLALQSLIVSADGVIAIQPIDPTEALAYLQNLLAAWHQGLQMPLPVACRTAFVWLNAAEEKALDAAKSQYEGDDWNTGEVDYDAYLARFFPDFESLYQTDAGDFETWANLLYRPMYLNLVTKS
jgi:exodeoxyribonuclease V gamma subunit